MEYPVVKTEGEIKLPRSGLVHLASTFSFHNVVLSEKYPSLVRVCTLPHMSNLRSIAF